MKLPGHLMILASAGSGKTYALTNRFVQLLACGAPPETHRRPDVHPKGGRRVLRRDRQQACAGRGRRGGGARARTRDRRAGNGRGGFSATAPGHGGCDAPLHLGTLDSFFAQIVRSFPIELGLSGDFAIMDAHDVTFERRRVLRLMFARTGAELTSDSGISSRRSSAPHLASTKSSLPAGSTTLSTAMPKLF